MAIHNLQDGSLKKNYPERKEKHDTEDNTAHNDKTSVTKGTKKSTIDGKLKSSIGNRQLLSKGNRTPKQYKLADAVTSIKNSAQGPSVTYERGIINSVDGARNNSLEFCTGTNEVIPFSNEFSTAERDIEHLIANLDSKTKSSIEKQRKQPSSAGKVLQFKINDPKLISSSGSKIVLSNNTGFIDSITVEIKLNKEQLMNEFVNGELQQREQDNTTLKAGKETPVTKDEYNASDKLKQLILQRLNQQGKETTIPFDKKRISHDTCQKTNSYGEEFIKHKRMATQRWISDLLKSIGGAETITELTENDRSKVGDKDRKRVKSQNGGLHFLAPSSNLSSKGRPTKALPLMNKQNISKQNPQMTLRNLVANDHSGKLQTEWPAKCLSRDHKEQQRKAERDARIAMWQEKNGCISGTLKDKNLQVGLVGKVRSSIY